MVRVRVHNITRAKVAACGHSHRMFAGLGTGGTLISWLNMRRWPAVKKYPVKEQTGVIRRERKKGAWRRRIR